MSRQIAVINKSTVVSPTDFAAAVAAVQIQVSRDFAPIWGLDAKLVAQTHDVTTERIYILDDSDQANALGYHETDKHDVPVGYVFAKTSLDNGEHWQATFSHETLEQV